ncbi:MAG: 3-deoxy-D-manno-octulosonic-acid transferase [Vicingaceae bacterium]|jgi:3-deoxy-D-manno-octulosonic-acid transferase
MRTIYSTLILLYGSAIRLAGLLGNSKARLWHAGRKNWREDLKRLNLKEQKTAWFHAASLGEFEQARPLIEEYKVRFPAHFILLSFFSPSGYEIQKNYDLANLVVYLPSDTQKNARDFLNLVKPTNIFFIKYEFWFNYLNRIKELEINCYLISGIFRRKQHFFGIYGIWFSNHLNAFSHFFVQNSSSKNLLKSIAFNNVTVSGDTRLDRVKKIARDDFKNPLIEAFCKNEKIIIFGSSWKPENELAIKLHKANSGIKIIVAPHEIDANKMTQLKNLLGKKSQLLSNAKNFGLKKDSTILVIDEIGLLSKIYRYATFAVIGGGFGSGIHNTLEAVVYGCPVIFGPNYRKFQEATDLLENEVAFSIKDEEAFLQISTRLLQDSKFLKNSQDRAREYVEKNTGATQLIMEHLLHKK